MYKVEIFTCYECELQIIVLCVCVDSVRKMHARTLAAGELIKMIDEN